MASLSKLDAVYRSILLSKFFTKGWGKPENLKRLFAFRKIISNRDTCRYLVEPDYPVTIDKIEKHPHYEILDGHFVSPFVHHLPEVVPEESRIARFQIIVPKQWPAGSLHPMCLHLAGTGDHFFWRRRVLMARPLMKEAGIGSILLENPFYGSRKPKYQTRSSLHNVSDIFVMGGCLILETLALFHWCERQGYGPLGISGISMGGHMASLAGCSWHKPLPIIPCLSWTTASCVFTQGVMSAAIPWPILENQYSSDNAYQDEIRRMLHSPEECEAFLAGIHFSRTYPTSMKHIEWLEAERSKSSTHNNSSGSRKDKNNVTSGSSPLADELIGQLFPQTLLKTDGLTNCNENSKLASKKLGIKLPLSFPKQVPNVVRKDTASSKLEALSFMRGIMDECTHLGNFSTPVDPSLSIVVTAKHDAYVPREGIKSITDLWEDCEVRFIDAGHIAAFLFNQGVFRKAIIDAFEKTAQKYNGGNILAEEVKPTLERERDMNS